MNRILEDLEEIFFKYDHNFELVINMIFLMILHTLSI